MALGNLQNEQELLNWLKQKFPVLAAANNLANLSAIDFGTVTLTWPGGSAFSTASTVPHNLGAVPGAIDVLGTETRTVSPGTNIPAVGSATSSSFSLTARMGDGSSPAAGNTQLWYWVAFV